MSEGHTPKPGPAASFLNGGGVPPQQNNPAPVPQSNPNMGTPKETVTPSGFFTGFDVKYPEYELLTPQTLQEFTIRSMSVAEEEILKGSLVTPKRIPCHINDVIWKCLVKTPEAINTKEDFLNKITIRDRDALLYALYHITYKDVHEYEVQCRNCEATSTVNLELSKIFQMKAYPGEKLEILGKTVRVPLQTIQGATAFIRQPTLRDEEDILSDMLFQSEKNLEIAQAMSIVDHFEMKEESREPVVIEGKTNLFSAYNSLPAADRKLINNEYSKNFGEYSISLELTTTCQSCNSEVRTRLDLVQQMFRAMYE